MKGVRDILSLNEFDRKDGHKSPAQGSYLRPGRDNEVVIVSLHSLVAL